MKKPNIKETLEELNIMLHKERNAELKMRIHMLVLLKNGECRKRKEIADRLAVHRNTIRNWLSIYNSNGLSQLLKIKPKGPASGQKTLDNSILSSLKERKTHLALVVISKSNLGLRRHTVLRLNIKHSTRLFAMDLKPNSRFPERAI